MWWLPPPYKRISAKEAAAAAAAAAASAAAMTATHDAQLADIPDSSLDDSSSVDDDHDDGRPIRRDMKHDCGECRNCRDKSKFGGPNKIRQRCLREKLPHYICPRRRVAVPCPNQELAARKVSDNPADTARPTHAKKKPRPLREVLKMMAELKVTPEEIREFKEWMQKQAEADPELYKDIVPEDVFPEQTRGRKKAEAAWVFLRERTRAGCRISSRIACNIQDARSRRVHDPGLVA